MVPLSLMADIERFTIMMEHSIRGDASGIQLRSGNMVSGILRDSKTEEVLRTFTDESRYKNPTTRVAGDIITVAELLKAAGVNLNELSQAPSADKDESIRSAGVVIIVVINYAAKGWNPGRISYEYLPKAIIDQEYKAIETSRNFRDGDRVEINRHGIRIIFSQTGQLGHFSFITLLTNVVAAVALFKVANLIVELMMLRFHSQKARYVSHKFEHAKDANTPDEDTGRRDENTGRRDSVQNQEGTSGQGTSNHLFFGARQNTNSSGGQTQNSGKSSQKNNDNYGETSSESDENDEE
ncbi:cytochrome c oxidase subunit 1, partial [Modicella reniformis]